MNCFPDARMIGRGKGLRLQDSIRLNFTTAHVVWEIKTIYIKSPVRIMGKTWANGWLIVVGSSAHCRHIVGAVVGLWSTCDLVGHQLGDGRRLWASCHRSGWRF